MQRTEIMTHGIKNLRAGVWETRRTELVAFSSDIDALLWVARCYGEDGGNWVRVEAFAPGEYVRLTRTLAVFRSTLEPAQRYPYADTIVAREMCDPDRVVDDILEAGDLRRFCSVCRENLIAALLLIGCALAAPYISPIAFMAPLFGFAGIWVTIAGTVWKATAEQSTREG